jgi:FdhE protein
VNDPSALAAGTEPTRVRLPDPVRLFERRAERFRALAEGHAAPEWLRLLSRIAAGQARAVREVRPVLPVVRPGPPLAVSGPPRDAAWRRMLAVVVGASEGPGLPPKARDALEFLAGAAAGVAGVAGAGHRAGTGHVAVADTAAAVAGAGHAELEGLAEAVLSGVVPEARRACSPFVGAALQAWLAALASEIAQLPAPGREGACPVCGGPPVAGVIRAADRLRWLTCSGCATEWNVPRVRCVSCHTSASPIYFNLEDEQGAKAEACPDCRRYVKLFDLARHPEADPAADDAATLALDLLVSEEGFHRAGPNTYVS